MQHGAQKLFGYLGGQKVPNLMSQMGIGGILEFFGGLLLALGLFTRPIAFLLSGTMAVAFFQFHGAKGEYNPLLNQGELAALYCWLFFFFVFSGPGAIALDNLMFKKRAKPEATGTI